MTRLDRRSTGPRAASMRNRRSCVVALGASLVLAGAVAADVLVTTDGGTVETEGPWKIRGAQVVFTAPGGVLSSMRLSEIDLEASEKETTRRAEAAERAGTEAEEVPPPPKEAVLVLTDDDIPRASARYQEAPSTPPNESPVRGDRQREGVELEVNDWEEIGSQLGGIEIRGSIRNPSAALIRNIRMIVALRDAQGDEVAKAEAFLDESILAPEKETRFRAVFPEQLGTTGDPDFQITAEPALWNNLGTGSGNRAGGDAGGDDDN